MRVKELLAKIGVSLHDSQQPYVVVIHQRQHQHQAVIGISMMISYHFLSSQIRTDLPRRLDEVSELFG